MIHRFLYVSLLWVLATGPVRSDDATKEELARLEGTWTVVKAEVRGMSLLEKDKPAPKLVIKGGKVTSDARRGPDGGLELSKALDPTRKPKTVTLTLEGRIQFYGIYELDGDEFRVCGDGVDTATEKNPDGRRPKVFDSNKGVLIVFKRGEK
jgi:uncharacterized protein (TIGR03067 family)